MTAGWRECADPVDLAAAVAAGVEVLLSTTASTRWPSTSVTADQFRHNLNSGVRYRVPSSWSPEPPAPVTGDDLPERRVWTCKIGGRVGRLSGGADAPMRRAVADAFTAETGCPVEFCFSGWGDDLDESELAVVEDRAPDPEVIRAALVKRLTALPPGPPAPAAGDDLRDAVHLLDLAWGVIANADGWDDDTSWRQAAERWRDGYHRLLDDIRTTAPAPSPVPPWPGDDDWCGAVLNDLNSIIHQHCGSDGSDDAHCDWVNDLANEVVRYFQRPDVLPAPPPVPPWPGAVLSGLCDEDGVPTWLAQAGQVRGEQVRCSRNLSWIEDSRRYGDGLWVEVRAPRAVPEPETERVPWWEAVEDDRDVTAAQGGPTFSAWLRLRDPEGGWWLVVNGCTDLATTCKQKIAPDGTVEVLVEVES